MRSAIINRQTAETDIALSLNIDGRGTCNVDTGIGFMNHMLTLFAKHSRIDLDLKCNGDVDVDDHHSVEDIGIALGQAFAEALGDKRGIVRYGNMILPMDEALILTAVDFSGRDYLGFGLQIPNEKVGTFDTELVAEFWYGFVRNAKCSLHVKQLAGTNSHHIIEGVFKSAARSIRQAIEIDEDFADDVPSTKGVL